MEYILGFWLGSNAHRQRYCQSPQQTLGRVTGRPLTWRQACGLWLKVAAQKVVQEDE